MEPAFCVGGDQLLTDGGGNRPISTEGDAIAFVDEIKSPAHVRQRFCVAH